MTYITSFVHRFDTISFDNLTTETSIITTLSVVSVTGMLAVFILYQRAVRGQTWHRKAEIRQRLKMDQVHGGNANPYPGMGPGRGIARARSTGIMAPEFIEMIQTRVKAIARE